MKNGEYILNIPPNIVWWLNSGTTVPENFVIHHKNNTKTDNTINNLEILSKSVHTSMHCKKMSYHDLVCKFCNIQFKWKSNNVTFKIKSGQKNFYCCRSHQVTDQQRNIKKSLVA